MHSVTHYVAETEKKKVKLFSLPQPTEYRNVSVPRESERVLRMKIYWLTVRQLNTSAGTV